jgi:energy-converting hydrogenase Eha subunit G
MKDGFAPLFETATSDEQPDGRSELTTNITVGIVAAIVGILVGLLAALGVCLWRRRNNRLRLARNAEEAGAVIFQSAGVQNGESLSMFLHH